MSLKVSDKTLLPFPSIIQASDEPKSPRHWLKCPKREKRSGRRNKRPLPSSQLRSTICSVSRGAGRVTGKTRPARGSPGPRRPPRRAPAPAVRAHARPTAPGRARALTCREPASGAGRRRPWPPPATAALGPIAKARAPGTRPRLAGPRPPGWCSSPAPCGGFRCHLGLPSPTTAEGGRAEHARCHCPARANRAAGRGPPRTRRGPPSAWRPGRRLGSPRAGSLSEHWGARRRVSARSCPVSSPAPCIVAASQLCQPWGALGSGTPERFHGPRGLVFLLTYSLCRGLLASRLSLKITGSLDLLRPSLNNRKNQTKPDQQTSSVGGSSNRRLFLPRPTGPRLGDRKHLSEGESLFGVVGAMRRTMGE